MEAERSHLVKQVLPKVRAACLARQIGFTEIDLCWGITEEEFQNGATVEICVIAIDRCRDYPPFFIGFWGKRYGWIPKHDELAAYWARQADNVSGSVGRFTVPAPRLGATGSTTSRCFTTPNAGMDQTGADLASFPRTSGC